MHVQRRMAYWFVVGRGRRRLLARKTYFVETNEGAAMTYASDYDDLEQSTQGEEDGRPENKKAQWIEHHFGTDLSIAERGRAEWQWRTFGIKEQP